METKAPTCYMNNKGKSKANRNICLGDRAQGSMINFDKNTYKRDHLSSAKFLSKAEKEKKRSALRERLELEAEINKKLGEMHKNGTLKRRHK